MHDQGQRQIQIGNDSRYHRWALLLHLLFLSYGSKHCYIWSGKGKKKRKKTRHRSTAPAVRVCRSVLDLFFSFIFSPSFLRTYHKPSTTRIRCTPLPTHPHLCSQILQGLIRGRREGCKDGGEGRGRAAGDGELICSLVRLPPPRLARLTVHSAFPLSPPPFPPSPRPPPSYPIWKTGRKSRSITR